MTDADLFAPRKQAKSMTSGEIIKLLAAKHEKDVFVPECKDGPTWGGRHCRMDAWTMRRSWSNPMVIAYEIKVSRSDFLGDDKWPGYLPCCNQLYFVCPSGLIRPDEVGDQVGLIWVSSTGSTLLTKKKAVHRDVEIPEPVWRYIVMSRTRVVPPGFYEPENKAEVWRRWLAEKEENRTLGYNVAKAIREHVEKVDRENYRLTSKHKEYDDIRAVLETFGYNQPDKQWVSPLMVKNKIAELNQIVPPHLLKSLEELERCAKQVREGLIAAQQPNSPTPSRP